MQFIAYANSNLRLKHEQVEVVTRHSLVTSTVPRESRYSVILVQCPRYLLAAQILGSNRRETIQIQLRFFQSNFTELMFFWKNNFIAQNFDWICNKRIAPIYGRISMIYK